MIGPRVSPVLRVSALTMSCAEPVRERGKTVWRKGGGGGLDQRSCSGAVDVLVHDGALTLRPAVSDLRVCASDNDKYIPDVDRRSILDDIDQCEFCQ